MRRQLSRHLLRMNDRGSTLPLILGFFLVAMLTSAAAIAAGDAFVQQRGLQDVCDGAALAAAASAVQVGRGQTSPSALRFEGVDAALRSYLDRDPDRRAVVVRAELSDQNETLTLTCVQVEAVTFGGLFGYGSGVRHVVHSAAQAPVS
jgi:hypothetical protein